MEKITVSKCFDGIIKSTAYMAFCSLCEKINTKPWYYYDGVLSIPEWDRDGYLFRVLYKSSGTNDITIHGFFDETGIYISMASIFSIGILYYNDKNEWSYSSYEFVND